MSLSRRELLKFLGASSFVEGANSFAQSTLLESPQRKFIPIKAQSNDNLVLAKAFKYRQIMSRGQSIGNGESFGDNCDYTAFLPFKDDPKQALLWVNHEMVDLSLIRGAWPNSKIKRARKEVDEEMYEVGASVLKLELDKKGQWQHQKKSRYNRRIHASTPIKIVADRPLSGKSKMAYGTMGNCAGGITPWNTVLTCEEIYRGYMGDLKYLSPGKDKWEINKTYLGWPLVYPRPPQHYGWVVEVNPWNGKAKKLTAMGRFDHECATTVRAKDGRVVVYTGDDGNDRCLYKFISDSKDSLDKGTLFVANLEQGRWLPIDHKRNKKLQKHFLDQTETLIHCRMAAELVGGSPLDRPEDIEIDPKSGDVFISLTNNKKKANYYGSLLRINEKNNDYLSLEFEHSNFVVGGEKSGLACPDNLCFDKNGDLWVTSDISGSSLNKGPYKNFGNNGLYFIPLRGSEKGKVFQVASAPMEAEFTGLSFTPNGKTIFVSVQHPGSESKSWKSLHSHWPDGGSSIPRSTVVAIEKI